MNISATGRRRFLRAVAISSLVVTATALTGCASTPTSGPTKITFSYLWGGAEAKGLEKVIANFNASQSGIKVTGVSSPDFQKQLTSMSSSNGSFDISDNFGTTVGSWAAKGILAPLDSYLGDDKVNLKDFAPASLTQMRYAGKTYALPIAVHTQQLLYNKDLLAKAGVQPPKTMDELAAAIATLTKTDASGNITQLGLGIADRPTLLTLLGQAFGGSWDGKDNKTPSPTNADCVKALNWYTSNVTDKYGADNIAKFTSGLGQYMSAQDPFYTGKEAMVIDGEWQAVNIPKVAPNLKWGVVDIPAESADLAKTTQVSTSILFIPANSKHKKEAASFLAYMMQDKPMLDFTLTLGNLPPKTSLLTNPAYNSVPNLDAWLKALTSPNAKPLASQPYSAQYTADLGIAFDDIVRGVAKPAAAMKSAADKAKSYDAG
jgi:multiple sugar transport system substrate-binding protein